MVKKLICLLKEISNYRLGLLKSTQGETVEVCYVVILRQLSRYEVPKKVPCPELPGIRPLPET